MKRVITESQIRETVKKVLKHTLNEGTTDQRDLYVCDTVFNDMTGEEVWNIISNYLDSDRIHDIANWLIQDEYIDDPDEMYGEEDENL